MGMQKILMKLCICISLLKMEKLLKAYSKVWDKTSNIMQKGFENEPVMMRNI